MWVINGTIDFNSLNLNVGGNFIYSNDFMGRQRQPCCIREANNFNNSILLGSSGSLAITAGYTAINQGLFASLDLKLQYDFFRNLRWEY